MSIAVSSQGEAEDREGERGKEDEQNKGNLRQARRHGRVLCGQTGWHQVYSWDSTFTKRGVKTLYTFQPVSTGVISCAGGVVSTVDTLNRAVA